MKVVVTAMISCIAMFALSLGATKFLLTPGESPEIEVEESTSEPAPESEAADAFDGQAIPVAFRPDSVSIDAVVQMSDSIRKAEQQIIEREKQVRKDEQRIKLLFSDLEREREELSALSEGIDTKAASLQTLAKSLSGTLDEMDTKRAEIASLEKKTGTDPSSVAEAMDDKVSQVKSWFEGLSPEQAADYLKEFANNGKLEFAASLLNKMPDRQKSKILGAMSDPVLVEQLIDSLSAGKK